MYLYLVKLLRFCKKIRIVLDQKLKGLLVFRVTNRIIKSYDSVQKSMVMLENVGRQDHGRNGKANGTAKPGDICCLVRN